MKAGIFFTGTGPIVIVTSYDEFTNPRLLEKLEAKRIKKFIAYEVPSDQLEEKYGMHYKIIMGDLKQSDDLRILDYDGHHVFNTFSLNELGSPVIYES